jgi:prevent-host-death family protein
MARPAPRRSREKYSIADARDNLSGLVRKAEAGSIVELTRHGKPVAALIAKAALNRLTGFPQGFYERLQAFRASEDLARLNIRRNVFEGVRESQAGRDVKL